MAGLADTRLAVSGSSAVQRQDLVLALARLVVGAIFLLAGLTKVGATHEFADAVRAFHLLPDPLVVPFAFAVPWLELLVGVYLLAGFLTRIGALGAAVMLLMFTVALVDALVTGNTAHPCGCFGSATPNPVLAFLSGGNTVTWWDVIRDLVLLALSSLVSVRGPGTISLDGLITRRAGSRQFPTTQ